MKKNIALYSCFIIAYCILMAGCDKKVKETFKESYPSGKLKMSGWVNKNKALVDTALYYYENGTLQRIEVRDDSGRLNGVARSFHENGDLFQEIPYLNNSIEGFVNSYKENGHLASMAWQVGTRQVGDAYWYNESGELSQYGFTGFGTERRNYLKFDKNGNIIEKIAAFIFTDSLSTFTPNNSQQEFYEIYLLLSNPPRSRTSVLINFLSKDSTIIKQDSITGKSYYFKKENLSSNIHSIIFYGRQYDSLTGKNLLQHATRAIQD